MRLIDAEMVKDLINGLDSLPWEEQVDELVDSIPTAYNLDYVEEQLKQQIHQYGRRAEEHKDYPNYHDRYWAKKCSYTHALDIVKEAKKE